MSNATTSGCFLEIPLMKQHGSSLTDAKKHACMLLAEMIMNMFSGHWELIYAAELAH